MMKLFKIDNHYHLGNLENILEGELIIVDGKEIIKANVNHTDPKACHKLIATTGGSIDTDIPLLDIVEINKLLGVIDNISNNLFTFEDIKKAVEFGFWFKTTYNGFPDTESVNEMANKLLTTKTEWNAEIQMFKRTVFSGGFKGNQSRTGIQMHESSEPFVDNGYVKILNLY